MSNSSEGKNPPSTQSSFHMTVCLTHTMQRSQGTSHMERKALRTMRDCGPKIIFETQVLAFQQGMSASLPVPANAHRQSPLPFFKPLQTRVEPFSNLCCFYPCNLFRYPRTSVFTSSARPCRYMVRASFALGDWTDPAPAAVGEATVGRPGMGIFPAGPPLVCRRVIRGLRLPAEKTKQGLLYLAFLPLLPWFLLSFRL